MKVISFMLFCIATAPLSWASSESYSLSFFSSPAPGWSKDRLVGQLLEDNTGFTIVDKQTNGEPFDDAESFKVESPQMLPYGRKTLRIDIEVGSQIQPLWENRLLQFQLNGAELAPLTLESGEKQFEMGYGDDGKGFVPAQTGSYEFELDKGLTNVQFVSFMTAGAANFEMTIRNVVFTVWPEEDLRPRPYLLRFNRLGYLNDQPQPVVLEWQDDLAATGLPLTIRQSSNGEQEITLTRELRSKDSGFELSVLDLELASTDYTTLIIPKTVKRTKHTTGLFQIRDNLKEYTKARDQALGAFHWFDMETYPGAHQQDKQATVYGTTETRDVFGGWYDAGDYGRYSVNGAFSAYMLLLSYVSSPEAFPASISPINRHVESRTALLDLVYPELDFLAKMQREDGAVYHKVNGRDWPSLTVAPADDHDEKFIMPVSTTATADVAALMNLAAFIFSQSELDEDQQAATRFQKVADNAQIFLNDNPQLIMIEDRYDGDEYGGPYTDKKDTDERLLATISRAWSGDPLDEKTKTELLSLAEESRFGDTSPDWMNVNFLAIFTALLQTQYDLEFQQLLLASVETEFKKLMLGQETHPYGLMYAGDDEQFNWGSNGIIATLGSELMWLRNLTGDQAYWDSAYRMSHWFFGLNAQGIIFASGKSKYTASHPHFRPSVSGAVSKPVGLLIGGPNSVELKGDVAAAPLFNLAPMQVYIDHQDSWATNEVAINWQAAWSSYLTLLTQR